MGHTVTARNNTDQRPSPAAPEAREGLMSPRDKALVLTAIALAVGGIIALQVIRHLGAVTPTTSRPADGGAEPSASPFKPTDFAQIRGISIQLNGDDSTPDDKYIRE